MKKVPLDIWNMLRIALLGEIYSHIIAIAIKYDDQSLLIRYYLDRNPIDFDYESIEVVATNLDATSKNLFTKLDVECVFYSGQLNMMDSLDGFFYVKRL